MSWWQHGDRGRGDGLSHRIAIAIKGAPPPFLHSCARKEAQSPEANLVSEYVWLLDGLPQLLP